MMLGRGVLPRRRELPTVAGCNNGDVRLAQRDSSSSEEPLLDLHGLRVDEAMRRTSAFLVREQARGTISVRLVTGHGTGALKEAVGELLRGHPAVASARPSLWSDAAMLVLLKPTARGGQRTPTNVRKGS